MPIDFIASGSSSNGGAVSLTIPAASDYAAVMVWMYEDISGGGAPTVPGGATATLIGTPTFFRGGEAYIITGLSAGAATFTPPASGGSQWCIVAVCSGVDSSTPVTTAVSGQIPDLYDTLENPNADVSTPGAEDVAIAVFGGPTTAYTGTGINGSTILITSSLADYGGRGIFLHKNRTGATTNIELSGSAAPYGFAIGLVAATGATTTTTSGPPGDFSYEFFQTLVF